MTGLPDPQRRHERRRDAGDALLDREAVLLQDVDQVAVGLDLLEAQLAEAEDRVDHLLRERRSCVSTSATASRLQLRDARRRPWEIRRRRLRPAAAVPAPAAPPSAAGGQREHTDPVSIGSITSRCLTVRARMRPKDSKLWIMRGSDDARSTASAVRCAACASRSPTAATCAASTACRRRTTRGCRARACSPSRRSAPLADVFTRLGVDRVRITGGEPLLRRDLPVLIELARRAARRSRTSR